MDVYLVKVLQVETFLDDSFSTDNVMQSFTVFGIVWIARTLN